MVNLEFSLVQQILSMVSMAYPAAQVSMSWVIELHRQLKPQLRHHIRKSLQHQQKSRTWTYTLLHPMVHLVLNPAGPVVHRNIYTTMSLYL